MKLEQISNHIFTIDDFLSKEECVQLINESEAKGYEQATVQTDKGARLVREVRNNQRVLFKDEILSSTLWNKVSEFVPKQIGKSAAIGLNELFRFYKYEPGQKFKKHIDESFIRNESEASYYTFMIYLNENYEGGETTFDNIKIKAKTGMALIFLHSFPHEGREILTGKKYVLRTDIMYRLAE